MIIRSLYPSDVEEVEKIHEEYYKDEFPLTDLFTGAIHKFVAIENGNIVTAGSVRSLLEVVAVTDKSKSTRLRREALLEIMQVCRYIADKTGHGGFHAFVQDSDWKDILKKYGFRETKGISLIKEV